MKRGIILLAIIFLFQLISAVAPDSINSLSTTGTAISELSSRTSTSGTYSARLQASDPGDPNEGRISITLNPPISLGELINISWMQNVTAGYIAHVDVIIDTDGNGLADDALVFEYDKVTTPSDQLVPIMAYDRDIWVNTFDDKGTVNDESKAWLSSGPPGPASAPNTTFYYHSLESWKSGPPTNEANGKTVNNNTNITALEIEVDGWILESEAFIDDIYVNGELAENFEPISNIVINEFTTDPQTDWGNSGSVETNDDDEFIELFNNNTFPVDITGWILTLIDTTPSTHVIGSSIPANGYFTITNPTGTMNNNGQIQLNNSFGILIDSVTYGNHIDSNISDNSPDGNANNVNDECLARFPNGKDTNIESEDFIKTICSFNSTNPPQWNISISNKTYIPSCILVQENVTLYSNISSNLCIQEVKFSVLINAEWFNFTGTPSSSGIGNYTAIIPSSNISKNMVYNWTVYVKDCFGRIYQNGIHSFYVNNITSLSVNPESPNGLPPWYISEPEFTLSNSDAIKSFYQWDSTGILNYTTSFKLEDAPNDGNITGGILKLKYNSDVCNETFQNKTFHTDFTNPKIKNLQPENNSMVFTLSPKISAYIDEIYQSNSGINLSTIKILLDGNDITPQANITNTTLDAMVMFQSSNLSLGQHNVTINATDHAGRNSQLTWHFIIKPPLNFTLTVHSPQNANYSTRRIPFNIKTSNKSIKIELITYKNNNTRMKRLCRDCDEYGNSSKKTRRLDEGQNKITIRATDMFGDVQEKNITIFIDSRPPKISRTSPRRNSITNGSHFEVKYTEDNLKSVLLSFNPNIPLQNCPSGRNTICATSANLSNFDNSFIEYFFNISDGINIAKSRTTKIFVDTSSPTITILNHTIDGRKVKFNITISEESTLEYIDIFSSRPRFRRLCSNCDEYGNSRKKTKSFKTGDHSLLIRATDEAGNSDTKSLNFTII
jgi:hypothetical protein